MYPDVFAGGYGLGYGPEAFMAWADSLDSFIAQNQVSSLESLSLAVSLLRGESRAWWRVEEEARWCEEEQILSWDELKITMSFRYIPGFQWEETELPYSPPETPLPTISADKGGETPVFCGHVPDQTKKEEGVLRESSTASELVFALIDQGESFQSLSCGLLTWFTLDFQPSLVEYLRVIKGLKQDVFEPGGSLSASRRSNNNLVQKTVSYKLDFQGFFTSEKQDLRSNLFEGREDGVILSNCSKNRGETGGNTFLISPINDLNKLRSTKQKLVVVKEIPELEDGYGDHYTRPPDQAARFLLVFGDLPLLSHQRKHRTHAETAMGEACLWSKWREAFAAAAGYELNGKKSFVCYILRHVRSLEMIEQGSKSLLKHGKGLQCWVFDPGDDHGSIILQDLDLRTNPFEGREYGAILSRVQLKRWNPMNGQAKLLIKAWLNGQFHHLIGMIYEVLDREKRRTLGTALKSLQQRGSNQLSLTGRGGSRVH